MENVLNFTWNYIVVFLIVFSIVVFVHEWGHFWVARKNKVLVEVFSIGFGPELFGWNDSLGTRWKFSAIPLGGYVKMFGERTDNQIDKDTDLDSIEMTQEQKNMSFGFKTVWQRSAIVAAGPIVNLLFAIVVMAIVAMTEGVPSFKISIGSIINGSAAEAAGLADGDIFEAINDVKITNSHEVQKFVSQNPGKNIVLTIKRNDKLVNITAKPQIVEKDGQKFGRLGVQMQPVNIAYERKGPTEAIWFGLNYTATMITRIFEYLGELISGRRDAKDLGGPLGIAQITGQAAQQGLLEVVILMAALSINLGLLNLFPVPMLDGGHLMFYAAEIMRGRPLSAKAQEYGLRVGLIMVLILMLFATWQDFNRNGVVEFFKNLAN